MHPFPSPQCAIPERDPFFASVSLLLHGEGANGSTTMVDSSLSSKTVTRAGNAQISTAQFPFGTSAIKFDGTGDFLSTPFASDFDFGTGDFTVECEAYVAGNSSLNNNSLRPATLFGCYTAGPPITGWTLGIDGNGGTTGNGVSFQTYIGGTTQVVSAATTVSQAAWHHLAVTRASGTYRLFLDGVQLTSAASTQAATPGDTLIIGALEFSGFLNELNGYIKEARITKGVARYTANFTPPNRAFPNN